MIGGLFKRNFLSGSGRILRIKLGRRLISLFSHTLRVTRRSGVSTRRCLSNVMVRVLKVVLSVSGGGVFRMKSMSRGVRRTGVVVGRGIFGSVSPRRLTVGLGVDCS